MEEIGESAADLQLFANVPALQIVITVLNGAFYIEHLTIHLAAEIGKVTKADQPIAVR